MPKFKSIDPKPNFPQLEEKTLKFWKKQKTFEQSVKSRPADNTYTFYDGPPFITGMPHHGTLLPSIAKDVIPRYWTMKGKRVQRVWGWDCHGLPTENKVEEKLGLKSKKDIQKIGIDRYIKECYTYVQNVSQEWEWYIDHIGRWVDFKNSYKTMDLSYMESVMWVFAQLYKKDLIYKGRRTSLFCPRCSTPLSNFEIAMDNSYKDVQDPAVYLKFKLKDGRYIIAWTTTPWTLPANLALAVNKNEKYATINFKGEKLIVAQKRIKSIFDKKPEIVETFKGKKLLGLPYQPLYNYFDTSSKDYKIYHGDFVSMEDGSGVVHIAPEFGEEDATLGQQLDLSIIDHIDDEGKIISRVKPFAHLFVKKADPLIIKDLEKRKLLLKKETITHSYPFCYRCQTPLIYKGQTAWYLDIDKIRQIMLDSNEKINWVPANIKHGRFRQGIKTAPHWCLSRSRYWASPIPVWECSCGHRFVPSSIKELEKRSKQKVTNLHKPDIDNISIKCDQCGKTVHRVPEVLDCWFESGSMPYGERHYPFKQKKQFDKEFPADYIIEYIAQTRGWFYTLHAISNALFGKNAFTNCIVTGVIMGTDGRKMSKLFKNYPDPKAVIQKYGGDALRLYFMSSVVMLGENINIDEKDIAEKVKTTLLPLYNCYKYLITYAQLHQWSPQKKSITSPHILDRWISAKTNQFTKETSQALEKYNIPQATRLIQPFIEDLSRWYIRQSRQRFVRGDTNALQTLWQSLVQLSQTTAPIIPFITEEFWKNLVIPFDKQAPSSIHLSHYPLSQKINHQLLSQMKLVRQICEQGNMIRKTKQLSIRQPLARATLYYKPLSGQLTDIIKNELNVKKIVFSTKITKNKVVLDTKITASLKAEGKTRNLIRSIQNLRKKQELDLNDKIKITAPTWPQKFESQILQKTLAIGIQKGSPLKIQKV